MKTILIIPAFNEAENIASVIAEVRSLHPELDLLVVDDGSSDATADLAEQGGAIVLRLPFNLGYGAAVQTGLLYAIEEEYEASVLIDGDGQHDPRYISALMGPVANKQADMALGSRFLAKADYDFPLARRLGAWAFSKLTSFVTRQQITDPTSGFQVINRELMRFFATDNYPADFPDADTIIKLYFTGFRIKEVPVVIRPRLRGESMHNPLSVVYYVYKMIFSILVALTQRKALRKGGKDAALNKDSSSSYKSAGDGDDRKPGKAEAAR